MSPEGGGEGWDVCLRDVAGGALETKEETTRLASAKPTWKQFTELKQEQPCSRKLKSTFQVELFKDRRRWRESTQLGLCQWAEVTLFCSPDM